VFLGYAGSHGSQEVQAALAKTPMDGTSNGRPPIGDLLRAINMLLAGAWCLEHSLCEGRAPCGGVAAFANRRWEETMAHSTSTGQSKVSMVYAEATGSVTGLRRGPKARRLATSANDPGRTYRPNPASALSTSGRGDCLDALSPTTALCTTRSRTCRRGREREDPRTAGPASI